VAGRGSTAQEFGEEFIEMAEHLNGTTQARPRVFDVAPGWWPIAHGSEIGRHPQRIVLGGRALAVYRDGAGEVRAVDDVCPHRRMPLSLGRITEDGQLQCAYHGWCFDGATGQCSKIPHFGPDERVKPNLKVAAFATAEAVVGAAGWQVRTAKAPAVGPPTDDVPTDESTTMFATRLHDGFVLVWTGDDGPDSFAPELRQLGGAGATYQGRFEIRAPHDLVMRSVLSDAGRTLGLYTLLGAGEKLMKPRAEARGDTIVVTSERRTFDIPRPEGYRKIDWESITLEISMNVGTGLASIRVLPRDGMDEARVAVALTPLRHYRTVVRWRVETVRTARATLRRLTSLPPVSGLASTLGQRACDAAVEIPDSTARLLDEMRAGIASGTSAGPVPIHQGGQS